ncbi:MAG: hypothetical protein ACYCU8_14580, partial [Ferrimicrobium acidiphilum]
MSISYRDKQVATHGRLTHRGDSILV